VSPLRWLHPEWGAALLVLCSAAALAVAAARLLAGRRRRRLGARVVPGLPLARDVALLAALTCVALALLGPRLGERLVLVPGSGVDLVFLVDVSRSMDATDVPPSRLDRAQRAVDELLARLTPRDRAGLAIFGARGVLVAPLTPDHAALAELTHALDTSLVEPAGSNLADGVRAATAAFERDSPRPRVLFVLSDGEDPERRGTLGVGDALRAEVRVLAAALGSEAGANVPGRGAALRDAKGALVVTRRNAERLARLAAASGGALFRGDRWGEFDYDAAAAAIRRDAGHIPGEPLPRRVRAVQVLPLATLAFALLALEGLRLRPRRRGAAAALLLSSLLLTGAGPGPGSTTLEKLESRARDRPGDARVLIELGIARLERGRRAAAERAFLAAALAGRDRSLAALAYYDLGVAALERADLEAARDAFFDALALDPADGEARFNLEWTLAALTRGEPRPAPAAPEARVSPEPQPKPPPLEAPRHESSALPEEQQRRWLAGVEDDLTRALRAAVRAGQPSARRRPGPAW
jgi:Mg-chelatase subunit ChlD